MGQPIETSELTFANIETLARCFGVSALCELAGVDQVELVTRTLMALWASGTTDAVWHKQVLNDDQVVRLVFTLAQELIASVGHLRPVKIRPRHLIEIDELPFASPPPPEPDGAA